LSEIFYLSIFRKRFKFELKQNSLIMKRLKFIFLALLVSAVFFGCKLNIPTLTAKLGDQNYKAVYVLAVHGQITGIGNGFVIMAGDQADLSKAKYLAFVVRGDQVGEYRLDNFINDTIPQVSAIYIPTGRGDTTANKYIATDGFVKITSVNLEKQQINGEFEFTLQDKDGNKIIVTNGKFENILYVNTDDILSELGQFND